MNSQEVCAPQRDSQINQEQGRLDESLGELDKLMSLLQSRLARVMREENIKPAKSDSGKPHGSDALVDVASCIRGSRQSVDELISAVNDMIERLEV